MSTAPEPEGPLSSSIERLRQEFERWMESARSNSERALGAVGLFGTSRGWVPPADVIETADDVTVYIDLPGVPAEAVDLTLVGNMLTVKGEKRAAARTPDSTSPLLERGTGPFSRSIPLPAAVNPDSVLAESSEGVLRVRLAKSERARARQIPISRGGAPPAGDTA